MNLSPFVSPPSLFVVLFAIVVVAGILIFYALRCKGDVRAEFSHGSTMFKLEAKAKKMAGGNEGVFQIPLVKGGSIAERCNESNGILNNHSVTIND